MKTSEKIKKDGKGESMRSKFRPRASEVRPCSAGNSTSISQKKNTIQNTHIFKCIFSQSF